MSNIVTPSQTCGPLFGFALLAHATYKSVPDNDPRAIAIEGRIFDHAGQPLGFDGFVELWSDGQSCRARTFDGAWRVVMTKPTPVQLPDGTLQAPHLHLMLHARGITRHLTTRLYFPDETSANDKDPVLRLVDPSRRDTLIARPAGPRSIDFDIRLQGDGETVFFDTCLPPAHTSVRP